MLQKSLKAQVFSEAQTNEPIMGDTSNTNLSFYKSLLSEIDQDSDLVIFDRLYLTQAYRAKITLNSYAEIENELRAYTPTTVCLLVDEAAIAERVQKAAEHRHASWGDYIKTKGKTPDEIADYYIKQQRRRLELLEQSKLPHKIFDTTNHEYEKIAEEIIKKL